MWIGYIPSWYSEKCEIVATLSLRLVVEKEQSEYTLYNNSCWLGLFSSETLQCMYKYRIVRILWLWKSLYSRSLELLIAFQSTSMACKNLQLWSQAGITYECPILENILCIQTKLTINELFVVSAAVCNAVLSISLLTAMFHVCDEITAQKIWTNW